MAASVGILCVIISKTSGQEKKDSNRCIIYVCVTCVVFFVSESSGQHKTKGKPINQWVLFFWQKQERCP